MNKTIIESILKSNGFDFRYCGDGSYIISSNFYAVGINEHICIYLKYENGTYTVSDNGDTVFYLNVHQFWKDEFVEIIKNSLKNESIGFSDNYSIEMTTSSEEEMPDLIRDVIKGCLIMTTIASINN